MGIIIVSQEVFGWPTSELPPDVEEEEQQEVIGQASKLASRLSRQ